MDTPHVGSAGMTDGWRQHAAVGIFLFALFGCAYGKLVPLYPAEDNIEAFLNERYEALEVSYSGIAEKPGSIRFDIKGDDVVLTGSGWQTLGSRDAVLEIAQNMQATYRKYKGYVGVHGPRLFAIVDHADRAVGYIYSPLDDIPVRPEGPNYRVDAITELDVRNTVYPMTRPDAKRGRGHR